MGNPNPVHKFTSENQYPGRGRPKGSVNIKTLAKMIWDHEVPKPHSRRGEKICVGALIVKAIAEKAKKGDVSAFKALAERIEGMPKQEIDQNIKTQEPISINFSLFKPNDTNGLKQSQESSPVEENSNQSEMELDNEENRIRESIQEDSD